MQLRCNYNFSSTDSVILVQLLKLVTQREVDAFQLRQIKLAHLGLIGNRQPLIQLLRLQTRIASGLFQQARRQYPIKVPDANSFAIQLLQESLRFSGQEGLLDRCLQLAELFNLLDLDRRLFECQRQLRALRA